MLPTLRDLLARRELGLRLLVPGADPARGITSVHVTDLGRPGRYLSRGELVLTNGLWHDAVTADAWVADLVDVGVTAMGYGIGTPRPAVPSEVLAACTAAGLPLVEVEEAVSFGAVARAVSEHIAQGHERELRRQLERNRSLLGVIAGGGGHAALLASLRRDTGLDVAVVGPGGRVAAHAGRPPDAVTATAAEAAARAGALPCDVGPAAASAFAASAGGLPSATLLVGATLASLGSAARVAIDQVAAYTALEDARRRDERAALLPVGAELLELLRRGDVSPSRLRAGLAVLGLDGSGGLAAVAADHEPAIVTHALAAVGLPHALARQEGRTVAIVAVDTGEVPVARLAATVQDLGEDPILGAGRVVSDPAELRASLAEAANALVLARARAPGDRAVSHVEIGSHVLLLDLLDRGVVWAFRDAVLAPLEAWDAEHRADLVGTLRAFLSSGGRWRVTAERLHVHPNTLRHRLERVERLTGRSLDTTADRVDLHLALSVPRER